VSALLAVPGKPASTSVSAVPCSRIGAAVAAGSPEAVTGSSAAGRGRGAESVGLLHRPLRVRLAQALALRGIAAGDSPRAVSLMLPAEFIV
jgi:hypothetical protein